MIELILLGAGALALLGPKKAIAYVGGKPIDINLKSIGDGYELEESAAVDFLRMQEAAHASGIELVVSEAFRTMEAQSTLYDKFIGGVAGAFAAASPGFSKHQSGRAVDIYVGRSFTSNTYLWLQAHAKNFGFSQPAWALPGGSTPEAHHWEHA